MNFFRKLVKFVLPNLNNRPYDDRATSFMKIIDEGYGNKVSSECKKSVDADGLPLPWFTYPAIEYLKQLDLKEKSILEWGTGNSTKFFASRCKDILSIEDNEEWYNYIKTELPINAKSILASVEEYEKIPLNIDRKYDIIIVDGIKRSECLNVSLSILNESGIIIFDNSDRNPELCLTLRNENLIQIDFHGFGPINPYTWTTSIFLNSNFDFKPISKQPSIPVGGGF